VTVDEGSRWVAFSQAFVEPVVFAQPPGFNDGDTAVVRVTDVTSAGFRLYIDEAPDRDGSHANETVTWVVFEAGSWHLDDGTRLEVGTRGTSATVGRNVKNAWERIDFESAFGITPAVITQVQTNNDAYWVKTRQRKASSAGVDLALEEDEAASGTHGFETVGWLAMEPGSGVWSGHPYEVANTGDFVKDKWYTVAFAQGLGTNPQFVGALATYDGGDPSDIRCRNLGSSSVQVKIEEDTVNDTEVFHTTEVVSYLAVGGVGQLHGEEFGSGP